MLFNKYHCLENDFVIIEEPPLNISTICDQHKLIGADGLIFLDGDNMLFFNKDGSKAKMCGNGIRCAAKFINDKYDKTTIFKFENKQFKITNNNDLYTLYYPLLKYQKIKKYYYVFGDVNHLILFEKYNKNKAIKLHKKYNINITFFHQNNAQTYEKGVGETRGCGSGLIAIMSVLYKEKNIDSINISSLGGMSNLSISNNNILLESKVFHTFKGEII
ncbi:MAG: hypothetical protein R3Y05_03240 [bacterium]